MKSSPTAKKSLRRRRGASEAEDLVAAAVNDAVNKVADLTRDKLGGLTAGLNLPAGIKLPF